MNRCQTQCTCYSVSYHIETITNQYLKMHVSIYGAKYSIFIYLFIYTSQMTSYSIQRFSHKIMTIVHKKYESKCTIGDHKVKRQVMWCHYRLEDYPVSKHALSQQTVTQWWFWWLVKKKIILWAKNNSSSSPSVSPQSAVKSFVSLTLSFLGLLMDLVVNVHFISVTRKHHLFCLTAEKHKARWRCFFSHNNLYSYCPFTYICCHFRYTCSTLTCTHSVYTLNSHFYVYMDAFAWFAFIVCMQTYILIVHTYTYVHFNISVSESEYKKLIIHVNKRRNAYICMWEAHTELWPAGPLIHLVMVFVLVRHELSVTQRGH